jgi:hypothetical protein
MNEVRSLAIALAAARDSGLVSQNFEHVARRIPFGEYAQAIGEADRAERGLLETPADTEVPPEMLCWNLILDIGFNTTT